MSVFEEIKAIIASTLNVDAEKVSPSLSIGGIPEWDSMGNMAIISAIEEGMGIEFPIEDLFELNSVEAIVTEIERLKR